MKKKIIIIGSGLGGLATGIRLAARGHEVEIYEKRAQPGGRASVYDINGFRFDSGASLITAPFLLDELWAAAGRERTSAFDLIRVEPFFRLFDEHGGFFDYGSDEEATLVQIDARAPQERAGYLRAQQVARSMYEQFYLQRADQPFLRALDMLPALPALIRAKAWQSMAGQSAALVNDEFLCRLLSFPALLVGGNPHDIPAIYFFIHHLLQRSGVWYPRGGVGVVVTAMADLFKDLGGQLYLNTEVVEIAVQNRRASGVRLRGGNLQRADIIVSNADPAWTYRNLVAPVHRQMFSDGRIESLRYGMSLFVLHLGTRRRFRDSRLRHHNVLFTPGYSETIDHLFNQNILPANPPLFVSMPTLSDPALSPDGGEIFFIAAPVPNLDAAVDWSREARPFRDALLRRLESTYLPGLRAEIVAEHYTDPLYFQNALNSHKGAAFALQPVLRQLGSFRPHNRSEEFDNLYFTGAGAHPGAGFPGVLHSAVIVDHLIAASL